MIFAPLSSLCNFDRLHFFLFRSIVPFFRVFWLLASLSGEKIVKPGQYMDRRVHGRDSHGYLQILTDTQLYKCTQVADITSVA
jgi:hypothetical protein